MDRVLLSLCLVCGALLAAASPAAAGRKAETYFFDVVDVVSKADDVPQGLVEQARKAIAVEIRRRSEIMHELPGGAPDPKAAPEKFQRWLNRRNMRAFRVTVEITDFERTVESPEGRDKRLKVHVALHMFGETLPQRSFGFTGDGSATVLLEIGSSVRERDETVARADSLELASQKAIAESIEQLREASKGKKKRPRKSKRDKRARPRSEGARARRAGDAGH